MGAASTHEDANRHGSGRRGACPPLGYTLTNELYVADFRSYLYKYEKGNIFPSPNAQTGVRESIAAALGKGRGSTPDEGNC